MNWKCVRNPKFTSARCRALCKQAVITGTDAYELQRPSFLLVPIGPDKRPLQKVTAALDSADTPRDNEAMFQPGQLVRVNLAGIQVQGVLFHAAVTDAVGNIVKQTSEDPPKYLVRLLFSFKGVNQVEVPAERIRAS